MKLPVDILDHIFSFLVSHHWTLNACSNIPVLSPIVKRYLYYNITVNFGDDLLDHWYGYDFERDHLSKLISGNPRIPYYVKILQIKVYLDHLPREQDLALKKHLDEFAKTLLMFPVLECIRLDTSKNRRCSWPAVFRAALEDRLNLPTLKEVHIVGNQEWPCSLIDNCKNIENLVLSGSFYDNKRRSCGSTLPELKSLTVLTCPYSSLLPLVKPHIKELRSLKCASSAVDELPELLGGCLRTLSKLDIDLTNSCYFRRYKFGTGEICANLPFPELFSVPPNLQQLTIRASVLVKSNSDLEPTSSESYFPAAAEIISFFVSKLQVQHLILEIDVFLQGIPSNITKVDFSPLAVLGSLSIPRIDLYIHTDMLLDIVTLTHLLSSLEGYKDVTRSIKEGTLVIHSEETAPDYEKEDDCLGSLWTIQS